jgi:hypothetical protein
VTRRARLQGRRAGAAVGGARVGDLRAAAKRDGAVMVGASSTARAHVRQAPPNARPDDAGPRFTAQLIDGNAPGAVAYGARADALVTSPGGPPRELRARYAVLEVGAPVTSHDPKTWARRQGYPEGAQERDYTRDAGERLKVATIAARLVASYMINTNPDAMNGAPIVDTVGVVLGGNGRTMGLTIAYADGRAASYRALLVERARLFGVEPRELDAFKSPLLVRVVDVSAADRAPLSRALNEGATQEKRAAVDAASLAARVSDATIATLANDSDATLRAYLSSAAAAKAGTVAQLVADGVITRQTASKYVATDGGGLTADGATMAERVLIAWAIPDVATVEAIGEARRDMIARVLPALATAARAGHDMRADIAAAAEQVREADARGSTPEALAAQAGLFGGRDTPPHVVAIAAALHARSRKFVDGVRAAAAAAQRNAAGQAGLFEEAPSTAAILAREF